MWRRVSAGLDRPLTGAALTTAAAAAVGVAVWWAMGAGAAAVAMFALLAALHVAIARERPDLRACVARATAALDQQARVDSLTGLVHRHVLVDAAASALAERRAGGGRLALLFVDIDGFRSINDRLGLHAGDEVLRQVADRVASCCGPGDVPARLGADEFVVLRPRADGDTSRWAEQVRSALSSPIGVASIGMQLRLTAAVGVVHADASYDDVAVLMADADIALYRAKEAGRATAQSFSITRRHGGEGATVAALRDGLTSGAVRLDYQPVVDLRTEAIVGAEALVRWEHPQLGTLHPAEFLSLAEAAGLMSELGEVVLRTAVRDFSSGAIGAAGWWVSVNLSPHELGDPRIAERVAATLGTFDPRRLVIEVQERTVPRRVVANSLARIAELGVRIAIDDFGSGPSSFGQLAELPLHIVKLDRSLIGTGARLPNPQERIALAHALVALAHTSGLEIVAEGIEHAVEAESMRAVGCEMGQGYLWQRPASIELLQRRAAEAAPPALTA